MQKPRRPDGPAIVIKMFTGWDVPTRNLFRHGRRRAFHLYHVCNKGEICFEDICGQTVWGDRTLMDV